MNVNNDMVTISKVNYIKKVKKMSDQYKNVVIYGGGGGWQDIM